MGDGEGGHGEIIRLEKLAGFEFAQLQRHGGLVAAQHHAIQQVMDAVQRGAAAVDLQLLDRLPAQERGEQAAQTQDVIEMAVREQDTRQALKAGARLQDLALRALAAVHQETIFVVRDDLRGKSPLGRRGGGGRAEEQYFEHRLSGLPRRH